MNSTNIDHKAQREHFLVRFADGFGKREIQFYSSLIVDAELSVHVGVNIQAHFCNSATDFVLKINVVLKFHCLFCLH